MIDNRLSCYWVELVIMLILLLLLVYVVGTEASHRCSSDVALPAIQYINKQSNDVVYVYIGTIGQTKMLPNSRFIIKLKVLAVYLKPVVVTTAEIIKVRGELSYGCSVQNAYVASRIRVGHPPYDYSGVYNQGGGGYYPGGYRPVSPGYYKPSLVFGPAGGYGDYSGGDRPVSPGYYNPSLVFGPAGGHYSGGDHSDPGEYNPSLVFGDGGGHYSGNYRPHNDWQHPQTHSRPKTRP